jgi:asparagine synthase (glutamine-hydrolysing)
MPGIAGILSRRDPAECGHLVGEMMAVMTHRPDYVTGRFSFPEMGIHAGWLAHPGSAAERLSGLSEDGGTGIAFLGEVVGDAAASQEAAEGELPSGALQDLYRRSGRSFVVGLNGLFCGLLADRARGEAILFNDRYGAKRLYVHEDASGIYFASEAKALLRILPRTRAFDEAGVRDFLRYGCTLKGRTLFRGIRLLPGGTLWQLSPSGGRAERYFEPSQWEALPPLGEAEFQERLVETLREVVPRYLAGSAPVGIAITGGLDTRMIMACGDWAKHNATCYTFDGIDTRTLDSSIGAEVARRCGLEHRVLRLDVDFLADFDRFVDDTVFITDGSADAMTAHEIYFNALARRLAPVRVTGNYGSEVLRGMSVFGSLGLSESLLAREFLPRDGREDEGDGEVHPVTHAAFREIPWMLLGSLAAGRSQLTVRTPYLDNHVVELAYRAPHAARTSIAASVHVLREAAPQLARIATDRGVRPDRPGIPSLPARLLEAFAFKLDYYWTEGLPSRLLWLDPALRGLVRAGALGRHKYLPYRRWFQQELAPYVADVLGSARARQLPFWRGDFVARLPELHRTGQGNYMREISVVATLEAVDRLLLSEPVARSSPQTVLAPGAVASSTGGHASGGGRLPKSGESSAPRMPGLSHELPVALLTGCHDRSYALGLCGALADSGANVEFIGSDSVHVRELDGSPRVKFLNLRGDQSEDASLSVKVARLARYYGRLVGYAFSGRPPVFHVLWNNKVEWFDRTLLMLLYKACGRAVVLTAHNVNAAKRDGADSWINRVTLRAQYALSDHVFVHTQKMKSDLCHDFGVPGDKVAVIPFGINDTTPRRGLGRADARALIGVPATARVGLFFGQIAPYKGLHHLVDALPAILRETPDFHLVIAGKVKRGHEAYWEPIRQRLAHESLRDHVTLRIEHIPDADVEPYFEAADVALLPYVDISQSGVPFLAFSFGAPVVATDVGSLSEDVIPGRTGEICAAGDPQAFAGAVSGFFRANPHADRAAARAAIREHALDRHSWQRVGTITLCVYRQLLRTPPTERRMSGPPA